MNLYAVLGVSILTLGGVSGAYFLYAQKKIENLAAANLELHSANQTNVNTIKSLKKDYTNVLANYSALEHDFKNISDKNSVLEQKLSEHDINFLATKKPALVESRVNKATKNVLLCFEFISGATLSEEEKNELKKNPADCPNFTSN